MTDSSDLILPDTGQDARSIHLVDTKGFDAWLATRPERDRAGVAAQRFTGKAASFAILPAERADEWAVVRAARELKVRWSGSARLTGHKGVTQWAKDGPFVAEEKLVDKGDATRLEALRTDPRRVRVTYYWPLQSHASMGPSCAVAEVGADGATVWTASQASHRVSVTCAAALKLPPAKVRAVYIDGAGCYGMNGHDDASVEAAMLSQALGKPVRVQWSRQDELGWDPKGPPQLLEISASLTGDGHIDAWSTEMWFPRATANLAWVPLLSPEAAGLPQPKGISTGLISQNGDPPYAARAVRVQVHWLEGAPLRPSNLRAPGKVANCYAVESMVDQLAARAGVGVTCVLDVFANPFLADGTLVQLYPDWTTETRKFYSVMPRSRVGSAKVKAFTDFLLEVFDAQRRPSSHQAIGVRPVGQV